MPDGMTGGVLIVVALVGMGCVAADKIAHVKPIAAFNREVCHIVTLGKKCKHHPVKPPDPPKPPQPVNEK